MAPYTAKSKNTARPSNSRKKYFGISVNGEGRKLSLAERSRKAPILTLSKLQAPDDEETHEEDFFLMTGQTSDSHASWGSARTGPISSIKKRRKGPRIQNYFSGLGSLAPLFQKSGDVETTMIIPNSPDRSPFLGIPLEVREKIYGFLLADPKPIVVGPDWETVLGRVLRYNALQYVCKQLGEEASKFVYNRNVFLAMLLAPRKSSVTGETFLIDSKFLRLFRNVVINCPMENWNLDWHEKAAHSVAKLAEAQANLVSLTIVVSPSRGIGSSTTALGLEAHPVHFADFFYFQGPLLTSICRLKCKVLNIVIKKRLKTSIGATEFTSGVKRLLISVDLTYLHAGIMEKTGLANEETIIIAREKAKAVELELLGLKDRFEAIFEDCEKALLDGMCRELAEAETITDGMALAKRQ
jgi:hypothetical protein